MKKLSLVLLMCGLMLGVLALTPTPALALTTTINSYAGGDLDLLLSGEILDSLYGLTNLMRIDDNLDQYWTITGASGSATARATFAGNSQALYAGTTSGSPILSLTGGTDAYTSTSWQAFTASGWFAFYDVTGGTTWSSVMSENSPVEDHMVTWLITGGSSAGNYVIAWEDLTGGDFDFNDMVVELSGVTHVPEPTSMLLLGIGLMGLAGRRVRKRFTA